MTPREIAELLVGDTRQRISQRIADSESAARATEVAIQAIEGRITAAIAGAVEAEREECAKILDNASWHTVQELAAKIRARSNGGKK